jgi:hypothetical protein
MQEQAGLLVKTGFLPSAIKTPAQAIAIMLMGRELNVGPMQAFKSISVIKGTPSISPELMLMLILRHHPNTKFDYLVLTNQECQINVRRPGQNPKTFSFSWADAEKAELTGKDNWKKYPRAMLRSRTIAEMARSLFPDAISGYSYTPDELGAETNEDQTEVIIQPEKVTLPRIAKKEGSRIDKMVQAFEEIGVTELMIEDQLHHPVDEINESQLRDLQEAYRACKADPAKKLDYFPNPKQEST